MSDDTFDFGQLDLSGFPLRRLDDGERVFVKDDDGTCMYVVRSGKVQIMSGGAVLENIGPNGFFGEMSLIDGSARSATAIAREPTEIAEIDEAAFLTMVQQSPDFALHVMRRLADRLRLMNESL